MYWNNKMKWRKILFNFFLKHCGQVSPLLNVVPATPLSVCGNQVIWWFNYKRSLNLLACALSWNLLHGHCTHFCMILNFETAQWQVRMFIYDLVILMWMMISAVVFWMMVAAIVFYLTHSAHKNSPWELHNQCWSHLIITASSSDAHCRQLCTRVTCHLMWKIPNEFRRFPLYL